jgi:hypothetical protein
MRRMTTAQVRPDAGGATRFSASARSTGGFDRLPHTRHTICRGSRRSKRGPWPHNDPVSRECRLKQAVCEELLACLCQLDAGIKAAAPRSCSSANHPIAGNSPPLMPLSWPSVMAMSRRTPREKF